MSRNRKILSEQKKHLTVAEQEEIKATQEHSKTLANGKLKLTPPKWLVGDIAKKEYRRIAKILIQNEYLGEIDTNNLAIYSNTFEKYLELDEEYRLTDDFETKDKILKQMTVQSENMRKYSAMLGMTVDSRLKFGTIKAKTIDDEIESEFGDI